MKYKIDLKTRHKDSNLWDDKLIPPTGAQTQKRERDGGMRPEKVIINSIIAIH